MLLVQLERLLVTNGGRITLWSFLFLKLVIFKIILQHITWQQFHIYSTKCSNINVGSYRHKNQFFLCLYWIFFIFCRLIQISNLYKYVVQNLFSFMSRGTIGRCPYSNGLKNTYLVFQTHRLYSLAWIEVSIFFHQDIMKIFQHQKWTLQN